MLRDELQAIKAIFREIQQSGSDYLVPNCDNRACFSIRLQKAVKEIGDAWTRAVFSEAPEHSLKRYFHFHLEGIRRLSDTIFDALTSADERAKSQMAEINAGLLALIRQMADNFAPYFDPNLIAPQAFAAAIFAALYPANIKLQNDLAASPADARLKKCVSGYLTQMIELRTGSRYTFRALFYYQNFLSKLKLIPHKKLPGALVSLNFNRLEFMLYQADAISQDAGNDIRKLKLIREYYRLRAPETEACDPGWPSITCMLAGWLDEELSAVNAPVVSEKLPLNLSVAHLACLTRLFFEENIYNSTALTAIFKFIAGHFQTKRQTRISTGGLSKEYYSISQVTAAVVRDKLLKMVSRINHDYFPVWAAIVGAVLLCSAGR